MNQARIPQAERPGRFPTGKFALGVMLALGAAVGVDQTAFGLSARPERLPGPTGVSPLREGRPVQFVRDELNDFAPREVVCAPGKPTPIPIRLSAARVGLYSLITIRGLPEAVKLSAGFRFEDSWAVALNDASSLTMLPGPGFTGEFTIEVDLVKKQDGTPDRQNVSVLVQREGSNAPTSTNAASLSFGSGSHTRGASPLPPTVGSPPATQPKIPATEEAVMMERASGFMQGGDVSAARLLYERLAKRGSWQGALALARTFDPVTLRTLPVVGLKPDIEKAKTWYKKAGELGSKEAVSRLAALEGSLP